MALSRLAAVFTCLTIALFCIDQASAQEAETTGASPVEEAPTLPALDDPSIPTTALTILLAPETAADLSSLAEVWQGHLKESLRELAELNYELLSLEGTPADNLRDQIAEEIDDRALVRENYAAVLDAWEAKGALTEELQPHRDYVRALALTSLQTTDFQTLLKVALAWSTSWDGGLGVILQVLGLVIAVWILMFIARVVQRLVRRALSRVPNVSNLLQSFIVKSVYWFTIVLGALVVRAGFGVNVTPLFAVFGGLSFILGFALQDTLGNLASGLMIMILKPFDTGDYIQVGGSSGFVDEMSVVSTKVRTFDNQIIVVPNSKIWGDVITNVSASAERRVDLVFGIGYSDNASHAIKVLNDLVAAHPMCLAEPASEVFVGELGDSSVNIFCRPWCKSENYWTVYWDLTGQAKERFDQEGISIPFPQRDIHLIQTGEGMQTT